MIVRRGRMSAGTTFPQIEESDVSDVVFVVLTVALFAALAVVVRGVEKR